MYAADLFRARKVGDRPGYAQYPGIAPGRELHRRRRLRQQLPPSCIRAGNFLKPLSIDFRIGSHSSSGIALRLTVARGRHPACYFRRTFSWRRQDEICRRHGLNLDMQIDTVKQWPRNLGLIIRGTARRA